MYMFFVSQEKQRTNILYLNLEAEYFNEIIEGVKTSEYRDRTCHYHSRIGTKTHLIKYIWFMNGMNTNSRQMLVEFQGLDSTDPRSTHEYVLKLGRIVSVDPLKIARIVNLYRIVNRLDLWAQLPTRTINT